MITNFYASDLLLIIHDILISGECQVTIRFIEIFRLARGLDQWILDCKSDALPICALPWLWITILWFAFIFFYYCGIKQLKTFKQGVHWKLLYMKCICVLQFVHLLAHLFRRESQAIMIARSLLSSSCKNFDVAHNSKSIKVINTKLGIHAYHRMTRGINLKAIFLVVFPFLTKNFKKNDGVWQTSVGTACSSCLNTKLLLTKTV